MPNNMSAGDKSLYVYTDNRLNEQAWSSVDQNCINEVWKQRV